MCLSFCHLTYVYNDRVLLSCGDSIHVVRWDSLCNHPVLQFLRLVYILILVNFFPALFNAQVCIRSICFFLIVGFISLSFSFLIFNWFLPFCCTTWFLFSSSHLQMILKLIHVFKIFYCIRKHQVKNLLFHWLLFELDWIHFLVFLYSSNFSFLCFLKIQICRFFILFLVTQIILLRIHSSFHLKYKKL